ncbi:MAG: hypothetical protein ACYTEQ_28580, partial [Planctomycetota bacterium]
MSTRRILTSVVYCVAAILLVGGCHKPRTQSAIIHQPQTHVPVRGIKAGISNEGRSIRCIIVGQGWDVTFMLAAIHGDEPAGTLLLRRLAGYLK